jgi:hypothetical protein
MNGLIIYYSYTGHTKKEAEKFAKKNRFDLCEVYPKKKISKLYAYFIGCPKSMLGSQSAIKEPLNVKGKAVQWSRYGVVHVFAPIWAGGLPPVVNTALAQIPAGTQIQLHCVSAGGSSNTAAVTKRIQKMGLVLAGYSDIKS